MSNKITRAEQRRQARQTEKDKAIYLYSHDAAESAVQLKVDQALAKIQKTTMTNLFAIASIALHDEFDFGHKRITRFIEKCQVQFECLNQGYINIQDLLEECKKLGIIIK